MLQLSSFKLHGKPYEQRKLVDPSLITPHSSTIDKMTEYVDIIDRITLLKEKCQIFDIIPNNHHMIRALCVVCLSNDTNPDGISRVGPISLMKQMIEIYKDRKDTTVESVISGID